MSQHLIFMLGFQSQGGFWNNNASIYQEAALVAASIGANGRGTLVNEIVRRVPGKTVTHVGEVQSLGDYSSPVMGDGGTAFVADTINPTLAPGDDTPLTGPSDGRLNAVRGTAFLNNFNTELAARAGAAERIIVYMFHYTHDIADTIGNNAVNQCRGLTLWWNYVRSRLLTTGKPFRMYIVPAGFSDRLSPWNRARIHEAQSHICVNGRRSTDPALAGFPVIPDLYLAGGAQCMVSFGVAAQADNGTSSDFAHQSQASSIRLARVLALEFSRWLNPALPQEYDGIPFAQNAFWDAANSRIRVRVKITAGNRLVWVPRPAEDAASFMLEAGVPWDVTDWRFSGHGHVLVHAHRFYQAAGFARARAERIPVTAISVDNSPSSTGFAFLDLSIGTVLPTRGTCVSIQPAAGYRGYWRQAEAIATNLKLLAGLREENGGTPFAVSAACEDVIAAAGTPGSVWLPVRSDLNVPVLRFDPGASIFA